MRRVLLPATGTPADVVAEAVSAVRSGALVALPTETVYGLVALPADPESIARLQRVKDRPQEQVFTHHIADAEQVDAFAAVVPGRVRRLLARYWPGPLTIVLPARDAGTIGLRVPAHDFTRAVIRALGPSVFMSSINRSGEPPLIDPDAIAAGFGDRIDVLFDAGRPPLQQASTVVRYMPSPDDVADGPGRGELVVLREGTLTTADVLGTAATHVLFVCTGNTCRSPLAEVLARRAAARALGTTDDGVFARGFAFRSAGVAAYDGEPASEGSIRAAQEIGLDLASHRATALTPELVERADRIFCLGPSHLVAARALAPGATDRIELLDPTGGAIPDPFGGDIETYRRTRDAIARVIDLRLTELIGSSTEPTN